jgi:hypothetical protein
MTTPTPRAALSANGAMVSGPQTHRAQSRPASQNYYGAVFNFRSAQKAPVCHRNRGAADYNQQKGHHTWLITD